MKNVRRRRKRKAFTLIELMLTSFMTGMLILVVVTAMGSVFDTKKDISDNFNARYNILNISNTFQEEINKATIVYFSSTRVVVSINSSTYGIDSGDAIISEYKIADDYIHYNGIPIIPVEKNSAEFKKELKGTDTYLVMSFKPRVVQNQSNLTTNEDIINLSAMLKFGQIKSITDYVEVNNEM